MRASNVDRRPSEGLKLLLVAGLGFFFMFREHVHVEGGAAKIALKKLHSLVGYALAVTLTARIAWGFLGNRFVRWRAVLPERRTLPLAAREALSVLRNEPTKQITGFKVYGDQDEVSEEE